MFGGGRASFLLETRMLMTPAAASQLSFERVGMEDNTNVATAAFGDQQVLFAFHRFDLHLFRGDVGMLGLVLSQQVLELGFQI